MSKFHEEFFRRTTPNHDKLTIYLHKNLDNLLNFLNIKNTLYSDIQKIKFETEVICKSNNFIIGYADAVLTIIETSHDKEGEWFDLWMKRYRDDLIRYKIIFELKPCLTSWNGVLRQIKTYMDVLPKSSCFANNRGVILTFSDVDLESRFILARENVDVITLTEEGKIKPFLKDTIENRRENSEHKTGLGVFFERTEVSS